MLDHLSTQARTRAAKRIAAKVKKFGPIEIGEVYRRELGKIKNPHDRNSVDLLARHLIESEQNHTLASFDILNTNTILAITGVLTFAAAYVEIRASLTWSLIISFSVTVLAKLVFRTFDRSYLFRRLFAATVIMSLGLFTASNFKLSMSAGNFSMSLGEDLSTNMLVALVALLFVTGIPAAWEHAVRRQG